MLDRHRFVRLVTAGDASSTSNKKEERKKQQQQEKEEERKVTIKKRDRLENSFHVGASENEWAEL